MNYRLSDRLTTYQQQVTICYKSNKTPDTEIYKSSGYLLFEIEISLPSEPEHFIRIESP